MSSEFRVSDTEYPLYTLLDCMRELESCNATTIHCMQELHRLSDLCGTDELNTYMENGIRDTEHAILWMKAAISFLENK